MTTKIRKSKKIQKLIAQAEENAKKLAFVDEKFNKEIKQDDSFFWLLNRQPLLVGEGVIEKFFDECDNEKEFLAYLLRGLELATKDTGCFWKYESNLYSVFFAKILNMLHLDIDENTTEIQEFCDQYLVFDFLIRTKAFCFINYANIKRRYMFEDEWFHYQSLLQAFLCSNKLPKQIRINFKNITSIQEIMKKAEIFKVNFDLSPIEFAALSGALLGITLAEHPEFLGQYTSENNLKLICKKFGNEKVIFDISFASEIWEPTKRRIIEKEHENILRAIADDNRPISSEEEENEGILPHIESETEKKQIKELKNICKKEELFCSLHTLINIETLPYVPYWKRHGAPMTKEQTELIDNCKNKFDELKKISKEEINSYFHPAIVLRTYHFILESNKPTNIETLVQMFLDLYSDNKWEYREFMERTTLDFELSLLGDEDDIEEWKCRLALLIAFPYLINDYGLGGTVPEKKNFINDFLKYGGSYSASKKMQPRD